MASEQTLTSVSNRDLLPAPGAFGSRIIQAASALARWSDTADGLSCTFLGSAHRAVARELRERMADAGMQAHIDGVGNVIGRYPSPRPGAKTLIVGSHYDTVHNAGRYDGRLGIIIGLIVAEYIAKAGIVLPFHYEVVGFSEEEGVRFSLPYIGSAALAGHFDPQWLKRRDAEGTTLSSALREAGNDPGAIASLAFHKEEILGYIEVHIEQGPILQQQGLPLGVVSSIAGTARLNISVTGEAGHAGTVPMALRHDALAAAAEVILMVERRCAAVPRLVGTVGRIQVASAAPNVIPGRVEFSVDLRAAEDRVRDSAIDDLRAGLIDIHSRRNVTFETRELSRVPAVACTPHLREHLERAVADIGIKPYSLYSGAGHDAVMFDGLTEVAMLFVRCGNGGISHSSRETVTIEDAGAPALFDAILAIAAEQAG